MPAAVHEPRARRRDVSRFLAEHEACASEFEIRRIAGDGKGRLRLECAGCGERAAYDVGQPGVLSEVAGDRGRAPASRRLTREQLERWLPAPAALPWWVPNAYIVAIIGVGLALIAFGLLAPREEDHPVFAGGGEPEATVPLQPPAAEAPAPPPTSVAGAAGVSGQEDDDDPPELGPPRNAPDLDQVTVLNRFSIGVPAGWLRGLSGGAVVFTTPGRDAMLRVFLERGAESPERLSRRAADFLERERPNAEISDPGRFRLGGDRAVHLLASWEGGSEHAALVSDGEYSYLLLTTVESDAAKTTRKGALAALYSFQAL